MSLSKITTEQRKPQNQIINRQMRRTQVVKRELLQKLLEEQNSTQISIQAEPTADDANKQTKSGWLQILVSMLRSVTQR